MVRRKAISEKTLEKQKYLKGEDKYAKFRTPEYIAWRSAVLKRDNYKCVVCGRGKPTVKVLQADHILSWSRHPESRFSVDNGRTLCLYHHKRTLNYGFKANNCDDELNGAAWIIKERLLWNKKQIAKEKQGLSKLRQKVLQKVKVRRAGFTQKKILNSLKPKG